MSTSCHGSESYAHKHTTTMKVLKTERVSYRRRQARSKSTLVVLRIDHQTLIAVASTAKTPFNKLYLCSCFGSQSFGTRPQRLGQEEIIVVGCVGHKAHYVTPSLWRIYEQEHAAAAQTSNIPNLNFTVTHCLATPVAMPPWCHLRYIQPHEVVSTYPATPTRYPRPTAHNSSTMLL